MQTGNTTIVGTTVITAQSRADLDAILAWMDKYGTASEAPDQRIVDFNKFTITIIDNSTRSQWNE